MPVITEIPKIALLEAQDILKNKYRKESPIGDLDTEGEKLLGKYVKETYNSEFVFITHYPKEASRCIRCQIRRMHCNGFF